MWRCLVFLILAAGFIAPRVQADGLIVPPSVVGTAARGQIPGSATNDSATAGNVGEYVAGITDFNSKITLTSGTVVNITSISLTPGDWGVSGVVYWTGSGAPSVTYLIGNVTTTSAANNSTPGQFAYGAAMTSLDLNSSATMPPTRFSISTPTTVYLTTVASSTGTIQAYGGIFARRMR